MVSMTTPNDCDVDRLRAWNDDVGTYDVGVCDVFMSPECTSVLPGLGLACDVERSAGAVIGLSIRLVGRSGRCCFSRFIGVGMSIGRLNAARWRCGDIISAKFMAFCMFSRFACDCICIKSIGEYLTSDEVLERGLSAGGGTGKPLCNASIRLSSFCACTC